MNKKEPGRPGSFLHFLTKYTVYFHSEIYGMAFVVRTAAGNIGISNPDKVEPAFNEKRNIIATNITNLQTVSINGKSGLALIFALFDCYFDTILAIKRRVAPS